MEKFEDRLFAESRLRLWGAAILIGYAVSFLLRFVAGDWILRPDGIPAVADYNWLWAGGKFALARDAVDAYDYEHFAAMQATLGKLVADNIAYFHWVYPPTLLLVAAPLALLPYSAGFLAWVSATLCIYLAAIRAIVPRVSALVLALLAFPAQKTIDLGQTGFVTAGLLGLSLGVMETRPFLAGILLGLLTIKPQIGVLIPIVLVVAGRWRVIAGAAAGTLLFALAATLAFGWEAWPAFLHKLQDADPTSLMPRESHHLGVDATIQTVFGVAHWFGADAMTEWLAQGLVGIPVAVIVIAIWWARVPFALKAASLVAGILLVTPYLLAYDLTIAIVAAAFIVRDGLARGFFPGERLILLGCFLAAFLLLLAPLGAFIALVLLGLTIRRAITASGAAALPI